MREIRFTAQGRVLKFAITPVDTGTSQNRGVGHMAAARVPVHSMIASIRPSEAVRGRRATTDLSQVAIVHATQTGSKRPHAQVGPVTLITPSLIVEGARTDDLKAARSGGARLVHEGYDGKALLSLNTLDEMAIVLDLLTKREVGSVTPNFLRRFSKFAPSVPTHAWAHAMLDVAGAWAITKGSATIRVAVLDEGVDTGHRALKAAVVGERDFVGGNGNSAAPSGDDAHGTACAGIILARGTTARGIAPKCSLLAARIAMDDGQGNWVFDDYATADAIDWAWRADAAVLSNSWGGGVPSDAIARAFGRARTQGRGGKGCVVCIAAGNDQAPIDFPGNISGYVTVGASNAADERKTTTSSDGENWWGSNYGRTLSVVAPGVAIHTSDITGARGYNHRGNYVTDFNGTSSATPHVAAAAALMLSAAPNLTAGEVRSIIEQTAVPIEGQNGHTNLLGYGRLNVGAAVTTAAARR